jgi:hypothetical protein
VVSYRRDHPRLAVRKGLRRVTDATALCPDFCYFREGGKGNACDEVCRDRKGQMLAADTVVRGLASRLRDAAGDDFGTASRFRDAASRDFGTVSPVRDAAGRDFGTVSGFRGSAGGDFGAARWLRDVANLVRDAASCLRRDRRRAGSAAIAALSDRLATKPVDKTSCAASANVSKNACRALYHES